MGIALSITAFPVLARDPRGAWADPDAARTTALACAAVDDVTAWCMLAMVVTLVTAGGLGGRWRSWWARSRSSWPRWSGRAAVARTRVRDSREAPSTARKTRASVLSSCWPSALLTELIGIHALFGAFLAGVDHAADREFRQQLRERLESFSSVFLLPIFFVYTGLRTSRVAQRRRGLGRVRCDHRWWPSPASCGGSMLAARWSGSSWRDAFALGALMNTRGLMELVALNVGYDLGHPVAADVHDAGADGARDDRHDRATHRSRIATRRKGGGQDRKAISVMPKKVLSCADNRLRVCRRQCEIPSMKQAIHGQNVAAFLRLTGARWVSIF